MTNDKKQSTLNEEQREKLIEQFIEFIENREPFVLSDKKSATRREIRKEVYEVVESKLYLDWKKHYIRRVLKDEIPNIAARVKEHLEAEQAKERSKAEQWWVDQFGEDQQD